MPFRQNPHSTSCRDASYEADNMNLTELFNKNVKKLIKYNSLFPNIFDAYLNDTTIIQFWIGTEDKEFEYQNSTYKIIKVIPNMNCIRVIKNPVE